MNYSQTVMNYSETVKNYSFFTIFGGNLMKWLKIEQVDLKVNLQ